MKFHFPSFLLGVGSTAAVMGAGNALRPVAVELCGLGLHVMRLGRAVILRQRERLEDLFAEIEERARRRPRGRSEPSRPSPDRSRRREEARPDFTGSTVKAN